jgi:hypothetical protein
MSVHSHGIRQGADYLRKMEANANGQIANQGGEGLARLGNLWVVIVLYREWQVAGEVRPPDSPRQTARFAEADRQVRGGSAGICWRSDWSIISQSVRQEPFVLRRGRVCIVYRRNAGAMESIRQLPLHSPLENA